MLWLPSLASSMSWRARVGAASEEASCPGLQRSSAGLWRQDRARLACRPPWLACGHQRHCSIRMGMLTCWWPASDACALLSRGRDSACARGAAAHATAASPASMATGPSTSTSASTTGCARARSPGPTERLCCWCAVVGLQVRST